MIDQLIGAKIQHKSTSVLDFSIYLVPKHTMQRVTDPKFLRIRARQIISSGQLQQQQGHRCLQPPASAHSAYFTSN